jgi:cold shock CspA family protein
VPRPQVAGMACGLGMSLASLRRFWTVAARWNSSRAPQGPRSRNLSSFRMCPPSKPSGKVPDTHSVGSICDHDFGVFTVTNIATENTDAVPPAHAVPGMPKAANQGLQRCRGPRVPLTCLAPLAAWQSLCTRHVDASLENSVALGGSRCAVLLSTLQAHTTGATYVSGGRQSCRRGVRHRQVVQRHERGLASSPQTGAARISFVHASALDRAGIAGLTESQRVAVDVIDGRKGPEAPGLRLI